MDQMKTAKSVPLSIAIIAVGFAGWLTFVLGAWNQNLLLTVLALVIPAVLFRTLMGRKMFNAPADLETILFGILLWNHMLAVVIILFVIKVLVQSLRK